MKMAKRSLIILAAALGIAAIFLIVAARNAAAPLPGPAAQADATSSVQEAGSYIELRGTRIGVDVAATEAARDQGLGGRDSLADDRGMLFLFPAPGSYGFWMKDMRFPIDIVWVASGAVAGWEADVDPQIGAAESELKVYEPPEPVDSVIELPAGKAAALGLRVGDPVIEHIE